MPLSTQIFQLFKTIFFTIIFIILQPFICIASINYPEIPESESDGEQWITTGQISYTLWKQIEPFYQNPISIPDNELYLLDGIFPQQSQNLPSPKELEHFFPWEKDNIEQFFIKYPELENLRPILLFKRSDRHATFSVNSSLKENFNSNHSSVKGAITLNQSINFNGQISYLDSLFRWDKREFNIKSNKKTTLSIGNFSHKIDNGLFFGYQTYSSKIQNNPLDNWLYPKNQKWNGLKVEKEFRNNSLSFIAHKKEDEFISSIKYFYNSKNISFNSSFSYLLIDSSDTSLITSIRLSQHFKQSSLSLSSLLSSKYFKEIPLYLKYSLTGNKIKNQLEIAYLPKNYNPAQSYFYKHFHSRLGVDPTYKSNALSIDNYTHWQLKKHFSQTLSSEIIFNRSNYFFSEALSIKYKARISPNLRIKVNKDNKNLKFYGSLKPTIELTKAHSIIPSFYTYFNNSHYYRFSWKISVNNNFEKFSIQPAIDYSINSNLEKSITLHINSKLELSHSSRGYLRFSFAPYEKENNKLKIYLGQTFNI